jgi:hypothetical protein
MRIIGKHHHVCLMRSPAPRNDALQGFSLVVSCVVLDFGERLIVLRVDLQVSILPVLGMLVAAVS